MATRETGLLLHEEVLLTVRHPFVEKNLAVWFFTSKMSNLLQQLEPVDGRGCEKERTSFT